MAETVRALRIEVRITGLVEGEDGARLQPSFAYDRTFTDGTNADQVQKVWQDQVRALSAGSEDLDLGSGGLSDFQGAALDMSAVKVLAIQELDGASSITLKPGGANPMAGPLGGTSPTLTVGEKGLILLVDPSALGISVTDNTADRLAIQVGADTTYQALIAGE